MTKFSKVFIVSALLFAAVAEAQPTVPPPAIVRGIPGKVPGDIISPINDNQIAAWCNFEKGIVLTRTGVLCVYKGETQQSTTGP